MNGETIFVNGKQWDWGNISLLMFGGLLTQVTKIDFEESRESTNNYGIGYYPIGYGNKNFTYTASLEMYQDEKAQIINAAPNQKLLNIPPFTVKIILSGDGVIYKTFKLMNCRFTKNAFSAKQNDSSLMTQLPLSFAGLVESKI